MSILAGTTASFSQEAMTGQYNVTFVNSTNSTVHSVKTTPTMLGFYNIDNTANAATTYVQFFNLPATGVTLGTTPPYFVLSVPASVPTAASVDDGINFNDACSFACTTTYNGATAPSGALNITLGVH